VIPDEELRISVLDLTFEHGLGLFETLRTWNGHPKLLPRHLERMQRSARELGLSFDPVNLPDLRAVVDLIDANRASLSSAHDVRLRLTLSGGSPEGLASGSVLWMAVVPLSFPARDSGAVVTRTIQVTRDDFLARHKTLNYWRKRIAQAQARDAGSDDVLCLTPDGLICETCRANIFLVDSHRLLTPALDGPLLPGIMRGAVLDRARRLGIPIEEEPLHIARVQSAEEAFLTNSVRGILPVARLLDRDLPAPGLITDKLWSDLVPWLESGGPAS
jgi:branched-subunit amino acid aminotransferase/4-amino-4-deoxychorismate lyase